MYLNKIIENLSIQKKRLLISIIVFLSVTSLILGIFFFNTSFFYQYLVPPVLWDETIFVFRDWQVILNAAKCSNLGYDVYSNNPCDPPFESLHVYGSILLELPIRDYLQFFYSRIFPLTINGFFIALIISNFQFDNKIDYLIVFLFLLSPSTLLSLERFNIEIFIFIVIILISYFRSNIASYFLIILVSITKFYPIVLSIFFIIKNNKNLKRIFFFFITIITFLIFIFYEKEIIVKIYNNQSQFTAYITTNFSIFAIKNFLDKFYNLNWHVMLFLFLVSNIIFTIYFIKKHGKNFFNDEKIDEYKEILFILGVFILIFTYYMFSNFYYREIYIFCLIPLLLKKIISDKNIFFKYFFYLICVRYAFFIFLNHFVVFNPKALFLFIKLFLDLSIMFCVLTFFLYINIFIIKKKIKLL
jgi:hypothetical protein